MRPFSYEAPTSIREAVSMLDAVGESARPLAGGTDLLVRMRAGRANPELIVDVKKIPELTQLAFDPSVGLTFGAAVTCSQLYSDEGLRANYPGLVDAVSLIGGVAIQGRATVGGNLCNSAPSGDSIPALIALGANCSIAGLNGTRTVPAELFCTGPGSNALKVGELLVSIAVPAPRRNSGASYLRFTPRNEMDIAVVGVGAAVMLSQDLRTFVEARISLGAVAPKPLLASSAGEYLAGREVSEENFAVAATIAQEAARPITDMRGTAEYRRHIVGILVKRALRIAVERAKQTTWEARSNGQ